MTANQLMAESNRINQLNADTNARNADTNRYAAEENAEHLVRMDEINARGQEETERHNKALESLETKKVDISDRLSRVEEQYKADMVRISEMHARTESERASIEAYKADIEAVYKGNVVKLEAESNAIDSERNDELVRHNTAMEQLENELNAIKRTEVKYDYNIKSLNANLAAKRLEYEKHQWDTENSLASLRLGIESTRTSNDLFLGVNKLRLDMYNTEMSLMKWNAESKKVFSETFRNYADTISKAVANVLAMGKLF